jgi:S-DNA-T family DNA segregation ATPase FtsK/SpoIIIE
MLVSVGFLLTMIGACGLEYQHFYHTAENVPYVAGGVMGSLAAGALSPAFGDVGSTVFLLTMFVSGVTFFTGLSWFWLMDKTGEYAFKLFDIVQTRVGATIDRSVGKRARRSRQDSVMQIKERLYKKRAPRIEPKIKTPPQSGRLEREKQSTLFEAKPTSSSVVPPLTLLDPPEPRDAGYSKQTLEAMSRLVEKKLADFNIDVEVVAVHPGPVITRFEIEPARGIKSSQIGGLSKDIARALSVVSVRVVDNIPGKSVVGLEVPNEIRETVRLVEGLSARPYEDANTPLALMLGKDIGGGPVITDLCKMPHLLIAGTTGSGKSVCINALTLSIIYKSSPQDVRLIMVDPKMLELSVYDGIPHLLAPVVTDMKEAANALRWCIVEMDRRYRLMAAMGVRNISGFNRKVRASNAEGKPILDPLINELEQDPEPLSPLPYVVVIIDELADLMLVVGKKVEQLITRLAQKGRASGIHLILATQRPSVDVITGLIKANIPSRIAFQVSARVDSRTVLDQIGADQLLGYGDMLYLPPGTSTPIRVHGSFVSDQEIHRVVEYLKRAGEPQYNEQVLTGALDSPDTMSSGMATENGGSAEDDPLYDQALRLVTETRRASISAVQRQLRVGYNRAARMIEAMEQAGVVGPLQSNGKREVLAPPPPPST